jgi:ATP-dependent Lhr-like helicase
VLVDGVAALYLDRGGSSLQTLPAFDDPAVASAALASLGNLLADGGRRELVISRVDGEPVGRSPWYETLLRAGFIQGYRGVVMRRVRVPAMIA